MNRRIQTRVIDHILAGVYVSIRFENRPWPAGGSLTGGMAVMLPPLGASGLPLPAVFQQEFSSTRPSNSNVSGAVLDLRLFLLTISFPI